MCDSKALEHWQKLASVYNNMIFSFITFIFVFSKNVAFPILFLKNLLSVRHRLLPDEELGLRP